MKRRWASCCAPSHARTQQTLNTTTRDGFSYSGVISSLYSRKSIDISVNNYNNKYCTSTQPYEKRFRVGIIGAGALGSLLAGKLALAGKSIFDVLTLLYLFSITGCEVWAFNRSKQHLNKIRECGLKLYLRKGSYGVNQDNDPLEEGNHLFISVVIILNIHLQVTVDSINVTEDRNELMRRGGLDLAIVLTKRYDTHQALKDLNIRQVCNLVLFFLINERRETER